MKDKVIKIGYVLALICFLISIIMRSTSKDISSSLLMIGGVLLFATSLYKIIVNNNNNKNG